MIVVDRADIDPGADVALVLLDRLLVLAQRFAESALLLKFKSRAEVINRGFGRGASAQGDKSSEYEECSVHRELIWDLRHSVLPKST